MRDQNCRVREYTTGNAGTECEIKIKRTLLKITRADAHSYKRESMQILTYTAQSQTPSLYTYLVHYVKT